MMKCQLNREKTELTIVIPYRNGDDAPTSSSGKSVIRASTNGNQPLTYQPRPSGRGFFFGPLSNCE